MDLRNWDCCGARHERQQVSFSRTHSCLGSARVDVSFSIEVRQKLSGIITGRNPTRGPGQQVFDISRVGLGRAGSVFNPHGSRRITLAHATCEK